MLGKKLFLQLFEAQSTGLRRPPAETAARWRCGHLIKNLTAHYNSQFLSALIFVLTPPLPSYLVIHCTFQQSVLYKLTFFLSGIPQMPINGSKLGLNITMFF